MDMEDIRQLIRASRYQVKLHAVQHALQEGFDESAMCEAILNGIIIESYPERRRVLICGRYTIGIDDAMYLHLVCEQTYPDQITIVTAYIPSGREWGTPPTKRRRQQR